MAILELDFVEFTPNMWVVLDAYRKTEKSKKSPNAAATVAAENAGYYTDKSCRRFRGRSRGNRRMWLKVITGY
jgi:hypothetical protein